MPGSSSAALLLALLVTGSAAAGPRPSLELQGCPQPLDRELRRLLEIELPGLGAPGWRGPRVVLRCRGDGVTVTVLEPAGSRRLQRTLTLERVALPARARLVALAAAELVATLEGRPPARAGPAPPPRRWALGGVVTLGALGPGYDLAYGGAVLLDHRQWRILGWRLELALQHSARSVAPGRAEAWLASAVAVLTVSRSAPRWRVTVGVGGRLGVCHLAGHASDPVAVEEGTVTAAWGGPHILLEGRFDLGHTLLLLGVGATYVSLPVQGRVTGEGPYAVDQLLVLGRAGVGFSL
jgi:hypothetical protein